jgi:hypothetical protein
MELNEFIDFSGIFMKLYKEHEEDLRKHRFEAEHFDRLITFVEEGGFNVFDIQIEECELNNANIRFVFGFDFNDANESSNYSASANYYIEYDRFLKELTTCNYEQG